jgi:hypothetical protein
MTFFPFPVSGLANPSTASSPSFSGVPAPSPTDAGNLSTGSFDATDGSFPVKVLQGVPANVRVQLSGAGIIQIGPNQYRTTLSLSGTNTITLSPNAADAHQNPTTAVAPNSFAWGFVSRNTHIATVDSNGTISAVARGECEIVVRSFRQVNASFTGATPSGTESVDASLLVTVVA